MSMVIFAVAGSVTWHVLFSFEPKVDPVYLGACAVVSGLAVLIRAVFNSQHARTAVAVLRNIYPVMFDLILLVITIIFFYAVLGLEIFQNNTLANSSRQGYEGSYVEYGCGVGFETFGCALLIVFQIVTTNDWHEIMLGAILDSGWPSVFYFISCYLIVDMIVMNLFVAISIEAYKKLAIDNNTVDSISAIDNDQQDPDKHENTTLKSAAKNTFREIFASSRNPRLSVGSGTLNDFASSPYSVRRGTLGSLGTRTPTPTPRLEHENLSSEETVFNSKGKTISSRRKASLKVEEATRKISTGEESAVPGIDRRQKVLKQRQDQRRKERRQTKQEEKKIADAIKEEENKLQIDGIVRLKKAVQVIKAFHARNVREMSIHEGDVVSVSEQTQNMYLGPNGWFPADHVIAVTATDGSNTGVELSRDISVDVEDSSQKQNHVKFNISPVEVKKQPPSPHHRISQTRIRKRNDGADWRRQILGDITIMNQDELNALSGKFKGGLGRRHNSHMRNSTYQLPQAIHEELSEEEEEQTDELPNLPRLMVSEVNETNIHEDDPSDTHSDTNTLTLPETKPRGVMSARKKKASEIDKGQNPPDWVEKFANKNKIILDKDVKLAE
uniref:Probable voltage-dependent N-type calcium channel subunit alpha-1B n=1 Tax=Phallusia mammillata TaxID=59560 RepID=A0A6F9D7G0_9ASCI|nr:probable voltage-dependent N-type calcium channel subunit alpha-1B [Phallusia mammillata]